MIYSVPTTKAKKFLEENHHVICTDEAEAVAMACGYYLAMGIPATVLVGENGLLNALDALITLAHLHEIPVDLVVYVREDEPQHAMVASKVPQLLSLYNIEATLK
jgi:sulfopyruvate decarboxylase TPP-binding subunit